MNRKELIGNMEDLKSKSIEFVDNLKCLNEIYGRPNPYKHFYEDIKETTDYLLAQIEKMEQWLNKDESTD